MSQKYHTPVMDVLPWPQGQGFTGATAWWDYVLSKDEILDLHAFVESGGLKLPPHLKHHH